MNRRACKARVYIQDTGGLNECVCASFVSWERHVIIKNNMIRGMEYRKTDQNKYEGM